MTENRFFAAAKEQTTEDLVKECRNRYEWTSDRNGYEWINDRNEYEWISDRNGDE